MKNPENLIHSPHRLPADTVDINAHIKTQAMAQKYMDSAVSKDTDYSPGH